MKRDSLDVWLLAGTIELGYAEKDGICDTGKGGGAINLEGSTLWPHLCAGYL